MHQTVAGASGRDLIFPHLQQDIAEKYQPSGIKKPPGYITTTGGTSSLRFLLRKMRR